MAHAPQPRQLALSLPHREHLARDDFLEGAANAAALAMIERWPDWPGPFLFVVGPKGAGKTHLAAIWAEFSGARTISARALSVAAVPGALATGALVVEDVEPGNFDPAALFHLLNLAREEGAFVLLTAHGPPAAWTVELRDLASRLRAIPTVELADPDDALLRALIVKLCADRQLRVDEATVGYLAGRIERSFSAARDVVERLDEASLRLRRPATRALAAEILRAEGAAGEEP